MKEKKKNVNFHFDAKNAVFVAYIFCVKPVFRFAFFRMTLTEFKINVSKISMNKIANLAKRNANAKRTRFDNICLVCMRKSGVLHCIALRTVYKINARKPVQFSQRMQEKKRSEMKHLYSFHFRLIDRACGLK